MKIDAVVQGIASEIRRYLEQHPRAADSAEGIRRWWIGRQRFEETLADTQSALDYLEKQGVVVKKTLSGQTIYHMAQQEPTHDGNEAERAE